MNWRSGGIFVLGSSVALFGLRGLISDSEEVVTDSNNKEELNIGPSPEEEPLGPYQATGIEEEGNTWAPSEVTGESNWNWGVNYTEEQKQKNREEAAKIYGTLNDYAFRIFMPCARGTGWILDYEIPKEPQKYPTKWYIATDLHVIWELRFSDNKYTDELPFSSVYVNGLRKKHKDNYEKAKNDKSLRTTDKCKASRDFGYLDINIGQEKTGAKLGANEGAIAKGQMHEPKLFFAALNFLNKEVRDEYKLSDHFADFGVVEFEFSNEEEARKATNDFATRYGNSSDALNLLAQPLETKYKDKTPQELRSSWDNYYILAYPDVPGKGDFEPMNNWDENTTIASHLGGFASSKKLSPWGTWTRKFKWGGVEYKEFGHRYSFRHRALKPGASGGLYVDGQGRAAGVYVQQGPGVAWVQPLRSDGTTEAREGVDTPAYDLISGVEGQKFSYKSQVQKYILKDGRETWLSRKAGWTKDN